MMRVKDIVRELKYQLAAENYVTDKSGVKTIEIMNAAFIADEPVIFGKLNEDYINRELEWYKKRSLYIKDIPEPVPEIWKQVASSKGKINSNYGWCIWHEDNGLQFLNCVKELKRNPDSRRAVMIYTRPSMHTDYNQDMMSDFICTNTVQYLIRDGKVHALVYMRSNDAVFGYKNDYAWQRYVLEEVSRMVQVPMGNIYWNVASLHVYERHFNLVTDNET